MTSFKFDIGLMALLFEVQFTDVSLAGPRFSVLSLPFVVLFLKENEQSGGTDVFPLHFCCTIYMQQKAVSNSPVHGY